MNVCFSPTLPHVSFIYSSFPLQQDLKHAKAKDKKLEKSVAKDKSDLSESRVKIDSLTSDIKKYETEIESHKVRGGELNKKKERKKEKKGEELTHNIDSFQS